MNEIVMFSECGKSQIENFSRSVLTGQRAICAILEKECFGVTLNDAGVLERDFGKCEWTLTQTYLGELTPFFRRFETGRYLWRHYKWPSDKTIFKASTDSALIVYGEYLLDYKHLQKWIDENDRKVRPGMYPLKHSQEIAAEILSGRDKGDYLPEIHNGVVECWPVRVGVVTEIGGVDWHIYGHMDGCPYDDDGVMYTCVGRPAPVRLAFMDIGNAELATENALVTEPMRPKGGDRLTERLYVFAEEVGKEKVNGKAFREWLSKHHSDFDVSHGIISYMQGNGEFAEIDNDKLKARIYRLKNPQ